MRYAFRVQIFVGFFCLLVSTHTPQEFTKEKDVKFLFDEVFARKLLISKDPLPIKIRINVALLGFDGDGDYS